MLGLFGIGEGLEADAFVIGNAFDDAREILFSRFEINQANADAETNDVLFRQLGVLGDLGQELVELCG